MKSPVATRVGRYLSTLRYTAYRGVRRLLGGRKAPKPVTLLGVVQPPENPRA